jgi:hemerythrin-like domain-containing protein
MGVSMSDIHEIKQVITENMMQLNNTLQSNVQANLDNFKQEIKEQIKPENLIGMPLKDHIVSHEKTADHIAETNKYISNKEAFKRYILGGVIISVSASFIIWLWKVILTAPK